MKALTLILLFLSISVNAFSISREEEKFLNAAEKGDIEEIKTLLENEKLNVNTKDRYNNTALIFSSAFGHGDIVELLIENGANLESKNKAGGNALILSAYQNNYDIAKSLIENGADVNVKDKNGNTALSIAKEEGYKDFVKILRRTKKAKKSK